MASRGARVLGHGREGFIMGLLDDIKGKAEELKDKAVEMVQGLSLIHISEPTRPY